MTALSPSEQAQTAQDAGPNRLAGLLKVGQELSRAATLEEVTHVLVEDLRKLHGADRAGVWLVNDSLDALDLVRHAGLNQTEAQRHGAIPLATPMPVCDAFKRREVMQFANREAMLTAYPLLQQWYADASESLGLLVMPLIAAERAIGVIMLHFEDFARSVVLDLDLFSLGSQYGAQAIERTRLVARERQERTRAQAQARRSATLQRVTAALGRAVKPDDLAETTMQVAKTELLATAAGIFQVATSTSLPVAWTSFGPDHGYNVITDPHALNTMFAQTSRGEAFWSSSPNHQPHCAIPLIEGLKQTDVLILQFDQLPMQCPDTRTFLVAIAQEIRRTLERTRLYQELAKTQQRLSAVLTASPLAVMLIDTDERVELWNPAAQDMLGYGVDEMLGLPLPLLAPDVPATRDMFVRASTADGRPARFLPKSGTPRDVTVWSSPVVHGPNSRGLLVMATDISEQKRAERLQSFLAEATRVFTSSLDFDATLEGFSHLAVPALGDALTIDLCNETHSYVRTVAAGDDEAVEQDLLALRTQSPPKNLATLAQQLAAGRRDEDLFEVDPVFAGYRTAMHKMGLRSIMLLPLAARGKTYGVLCLAARERTYTDFDYAFLAEVAARAALALDHARLYLEVKEAVRLRDSFLAIAGHELKTPLTALKLGLQSLTRQCRNNAPHEALLERVATTARQVERLAALTDELLDVARITSGRLTLQLEPVPLAALVEEIASRMQEEFARADTDLVVAINSQVSGRWDRLRLDQVITNLMSNALKYGKGQPVQIEVGTAFGKATVRVQDRGIGIAADDQARIFRRFERAVSDRHYGGMGLGLWIVHQIVLALGGSITVQSQLGQGATFILELPLDQSQNLDLV